MSSYVGSPLSCSVGSASSSLGAGTTSDQWHGKMYSSSSSPPPPPPLPPSAPPPVSNMSAWNRKCTKVAPHHCSAAGGCVMPSRTSSWTLLKSAVAIHSAPVLSSSAKRSDSGH